MKRLLLFFFFSCLLFDAVAGPTLTQSGWRWRNDDGSETSATWKGNENQEVTVSAADGIIRLRMKVTSTANPSEDNFTSSIYNRISYATSVSGPFTEISPTATNGEHFVMAASPEVQSGTATTQQLTSNAGESFRAGQVINSATPPGYLQFSDETNVQEFEWVLKPTSAAVDGKYYFKLGNISAQNTLPTLNYSTTMQPKPVAGYLNSLLFDGVNDYVEIPAQASNQFDSETEFTVSMWFKANSMAIAGLFNRPSGGGDMQFWLTAENGTFTYGIDKHGYGWTWITTEKAYKVGEWVQVTTVRRNVDGHRKMEIYANGILVGSGIVNRISSASTAPIRIGTHKDANSHFANGQIDNVSLWKKALTVEEIKTLGATTLNGNETGLAGYWRFDETSGAIAYDATSNANHGRLLNMDLATARVASTASDIKTITNVAYSGKLAGSDPNGNTLTYSIVTSPSKGTLIITNTTTGAFTYTPAANVTGTDVFTYKVHNGFYDSNTATVNVTIVAPNKAPVPAVAELPTTKGECAVTVTAPTANDDFDGVITAITSDPLSYQEQGTYTITWTYTDSEGLTSTQTQQVIVKDETKPVFAAVASINKDSDAGKCGAVVTYTMPTATDNCQPEGKKVLLIWDVVNTHTTNLINALTADGLKVTLSATSENAYNGSNPSPEGFDAVIHLNGTTHSTPMPVSGQNALVDFVINKGKTYITNEWSAYEINRMTAMRDILVLERSGGMNGAITYSAVAAEAGHPLLRDLPNSFTLPHGGSNVGKVRSFSSNQPTVLMTSPNGAAVAVRGFSNGGKAVGFQHAGNYIGASILSDVNAQKLYINAVKYTNVNPLTIAQKAGLPSGSLFPVGTTTNTFVATDEAGNTATIGFDVTITDNQKPSVITQNITVELDATGKATIKAEDVNKGSTDNCAIAADGYSLSKTSFTCADLGPQSVTLTVTDVNGNSETATAEVTIVDLTKPTITAPADVTVNTDAGKNTASGVALGTPVTADNCQVANVTNDAPATFPLGKTTVTWTVTDVAGNEITATQTVTVEIIKAPSAPDLLSSSDSGSSDSDNITNSARPAFEGTGAEPGATVTLYANGTAVGSTTANSSGFWAITAGSLAEGTYTFTAKATATSGSESPASSGLSVTIDTTAPETTITTGPASMTNEANATFAFTSSEGGTFEANLDGNGYTPATSPLGLTALSEGSHSLQVRATDVAGNIDATPAAYTWSIDLTAPTVTGITRHTPSTATTNASTVTFLVSFSEVVSGVDNADFSLTTTGAVTGTIANVSSTDNKNIEVTIAGINGSGTLRLDVRASGTGIIDAFGNGLSAGYTSGEVYTIDTTNSTVTSLSVPANGTYRAGQHLDFTVNFDEVVTVTGAPTLSLTIGSTSREAAYVSGSGSTSLNFRYSIQQGEQDMNGITLGGITLNGGTITDAVGNATVLSLSGMVPSTAGVLVDAVEPTVQTVTIASSNNDATKAKPGDVVTLSLEASEPIAQPTVVIAGQPARVTAGSTTAYTATYTLTAADAEGTVPFTITYQDLAGSAGTAVSATTDASNVIFDKTAPVVIIKDITIQLDNSGAATITAAAIDNGSSDNYGIASTILSKTSFDCSNVGTNYVVLTVTDLSGNTSTATAVVIVEDNVAPVVAVKPITVQLDASGKVTITPADINNSSTDNCAIAADGYSLSKTEFTCADLGPKTVTLTVTDVNGNSETATATVTIVDPIKPAITAPAAVTVNTDPGKNTASGVVLGTPATTDNCGGTTLSNDAPAAFPLGSTTVTWTVTDAAGNTATATQLVTVKDAEAPVPTIATLPTITGECDATVTAPTATDNISGTVTATTTNPIEYTAQGVYTINWIYTDAAGNQTTQTQQVVVEDVTAPVFGPVSAISRETDANACGAAVSFNLPVATDNCAGPVTITQTAGLASGAQFPVGKTTNTFVATDAAGNTATLSFEVTVTDTQKPSVITRNLTVQLEERGQVAITAEQLDGGSTDNCGIRSVVLDKFEFSCSDLGANVVTLTVTDVNGNMGTATATVTVEDKTAPVARAKNISVQLNAEGKATITPAMVDDNSFDLCGEVKLALDKTTFDCSNVGPNEVVLTVTDKSGNISSATAMVRVEDKLAPVVRTRNITVQLDAEGKATITADQIDNNSMDNCGIASVVLDKADFDCSNQGDNTVRLTVTDVNGNSATATAVVKVVDTIAPVAVAQDVTLYLSAEGTVSLTPAQVNNHSSDNCAIASLSLDKIAFDCSNIGKNTVTLTVRDASSNQATAMATVTVLDEVAPVVRTRDITVQLDAEGRATVTAAQINKGSSDNCGIETISLDKTSFDCSQTGANMVTLTVTDKYGNVASATATVTVLENIAPVVMTRDITVALDEAGKAIITADQIDNGSADNCGIESSALDKTSFDCSNVGKNTVTLTVTDKSGNKSTATAIVTVEDKLAPTAIAKNITLYLDADGRATITAAQVNDGSSDNCGKVTLSLDKASFSCEDLGENTVTLMVTDKSGNQSTATATVTVKDQVAPVVITQNITVQLDASGTASITVAAINKGSTDNCSIASLTLSKTTFHCSNVGTNEVVLTVTDGSGNVATGTAIVTVEDKLAPVVAVKNITVQLDASGKASITAADLDKGSTDNCSIASLSLDKSIFGCGEVGENTVILTVTDASGNQSTAVAKVTIEDKVAPAITAPAAVVVNVDAGKVTASGVALGQPVTTDNCSVASVSNDAPAEFPTGTTIVTWTVTDVSGNKTTATQTVTVRRDVVSVANPAQVNVPIRTPYAQVPLPATVTVTYSDGATESIGVVWAQGTYNGLVAGTYTLTGQLTLAAGTTNLRSIEAKAAVEVEPNKVPTALAFSATTFKSEATAEEVIGTLTTTDPDDTEFVYTLVSGEGDVHNALFEIRGDQVYLRSNKGLSGMTTFTIRVRSTDPYQNTIERSFTLTKQAYDRTVDQLKIVNAFSPNGDGINDNWTIPELRFYNEVYIQVFDRSGVRVFETRDPEKGWNGRSTGGHVLQGPFLYTVEVKDINWVKRGVVTILSK